MEKLFTRRKDQRWQTRHLGDDWWEDLRLATALVETDAELKKKEAQEIGLASLGDDAEKKNWACEACRWMSMLDQ